MTAYWRTFISVGKISRGSIHSRGPKILPNILITIMRCLNTAILSFAILLRILVGFHPHSGQNDYQGPQAKAKINHASTNSNSSTKPIKYGGDYEAQRHWMELTYHVPIGEWYYHDLEYWGLDYPPLTAYVSWVCGWVAHTLGSLHDGAYVNNNDAGSNGTCQWDDSVCINKLRLNNKTNKSERGPSQGLGVLKDLVALHTSRWGFEDSGGKLYMRITVLVLDLLLYVTAVWTLAYRLAAATQTTTGQVQDKSGDNDSIIPTSQYRRLWLVLTALSQPALIVIDHGHFQYNTVSLGLALWSFHFITLDGSLTFVGPIIGSILFSLALNFKQMELYHAPAIFAYLLGRCFRNDDNSNNSKQSGKSSVHLGAIAGKFCALGITVILTFAVMWAPFAIYPRAGTSSLSSILQIVQRLFPFKRGVFEGKVANLWCALSIKPFSIRQRLPSNLLPVAALGLTMLLILPPCWILFRVGRGANGNKSKSRENDIRLLLWGAASTSLAFFLASFQVHEKGILIALAPISMLALDAPNFVYYFSILATWSLWPLLVIDQLTDAYACCLAIFLCIHGLVKMPSMELTSNNDEVGIFSVIYAAKYVPALSCIAMIALHISEFVVDPPSHLPDLFSVLWSFVGCGLFCLSYLGTIWAMSQRMLLDEKHLVNQRVGKKAISKKGIPLISVLGILFLSADTGSAFVSYMPKGIVYTNTLHLSSQPDLSDIITEELLDRARRPLKWEEQIAEESKPVLDLSSRNSDLLSLAEGADEYMRPAEAAVVSGEDNEAGGELWEDGIVWKDTQQELLGMDILCLDETIATALSPQRVLSEAPQLLRLPTTQVVESASFLLSYPSGTNSTLLIRADPSLLTYCVDDLRYGVEEYLANSKYEIVLPCDVHVCIMTLLILHSTILWCTTLSDVYG